MVFTMPGSIYRQSRTVNANLSAKIIFFALLISPLRPSFFVFRYLPVITLLIRSRMAAAALSLPGLYLTTLPIQAFQAVQVFNRLLDIYELLVSQLLQERYPLFRLWIAVRMYPVFLQVQDQVAEVLACACYVSEQVVPHPPLQLNLFCFCHLISLPLFRLSPSP